MTFIEEEQKAEMLNISINKKYLVQKMKAEGLRFPATSSSTSWYFFLVYILFQESSMEPSETDEQIAVKCKKAI